MITNINIFWIVLLSFVQNFFIYRTNVMVIPQCLSLSESGGYCTGAFPGEHVKIPISSGLLAVILVEKPLFQLDVLPGRRMLKKQEDFLWFYKKDVFLQQI